MTVPYVSYSVKGNHKTGSTDVLELLSLMCRLYKVRKPTQDLRATSIGKISILISLVHDSLPDLITRNQRLMKAVDFSRINEIRGWKYDV